MGAACVVLRGLLAKSTKKGDKSYLAAQSKFIGWLDRLKDFRVLDPACGSGNFLFMGLKALKDIEHKSHIEAATLGLEREADLVTGPQNMLGIELNEYAAELARVTVWIGELQWRLLHGYEFKTNPVLEPLDHIECRDALLVFLPLPLGEGRGEGGPRLQPVEAAWPKANVVIGNPPFLGDNKMRSELGGEYTENLRASYKGRVPGGADLVCYWFEKARQAIEINGLNAAGLVATNSIRGGKNRAVLDAIVKTTRIYQAWSDEGWVNEGAAVRVSLVAFGDSTQTAILDGQKVATVHSDLSAGFGEGASLDLSLAIALNNSGTSFIGTQKGGPFDVSGDIARRWLRQPNPHGRPNSEVLAPWINGLDITRRPNDLWIVDFGCDMSTVEAALYEQPFSHVVANVKPIRKGLKRENHARYWWRPAESRPGMRSELRELNRYIGSARVAKYRLFTWQPCSTLPDSQVVVIARADDTTLGILHSRFHELWSLRMGTSLEDRPRYTPTTCFETFPFPPGLTPADTAHQRTEQVGVSPHPRPLPKGEGAKRGVITANAANAANAAVIPAGLAGEVRAVAEKIAFAAKRLNDLRENWLNPPEWTQRLPEVTPLGMDTSPYPDRIVPKNGHEKELAERTLTKLYNQRPAWLDAAHKTLDLAVAAAYGWNDYHAEMLDDEILKRLLALNLQRSS